MKQLILRVKPENTTDIAFYGQPREKVIKKMAGVLKELCTYKVYFELEISYCPNTYGKDFKCFEIKPMYLIAKGRNVQEISIP